MTPKLRLIEIHAAMPAANRSIAGAVLEWVRETDVESHAARDILDGLTQVAEAAWQIGVAGSDRDFAAMNRRIRELESREAEAEPSLWVLGPLASCVTLSKTEADEHVRLNGTVTPLYKLRRQP